MALGVEGSISSGGGLRDLVDNAHDAAGLDKKERRGIRKKGVSIVSQRILYTEGEERWDGPTCDLRREYWEEGELGCSGHADNRRRH